MRISTIYIEHDSKLERMKDAYMIELDESAVSKIIQKFQEALKAKVNYLSNFRYFYCTIGNASQETIRYYIESQG